MEKYLYFRSNETLSEDDDNQNGSNVYPLSSFRGMEAASNTTFKMFFAQKNNSFASHDDPTFGINDSVVVTISTNNNHKAVMEELTRHFANSSDHFIVVADDHTGEYLASDISAVGNFTVQPNQA
jgi:hypothetical protein|tara:strand:- start:376 stop:750 length:375 start_codon:yes stop_codon:yes gene_type:complete